MTLPSIVIGIVISSLYGAGLHLLGNALGWTFFSLGPLRLGTATLGAAASLGLGYWLSLVER